MSELQGTDPKVSIIIPCYNRGSFLYETVTSVLSQTYANIELVVVDDGCTDNSREILESFGDRLRILEHPGRENRGQSAGINLGIANTNGKYVAILDSDDVWMPEKIAEQVRFLEDHPDVGLVYGNGEAISDNGRKLYSIYDADHWEDSEPERVLKDCYFSLPTNSLVRRTVYEKTGGFDERLRSAQDHDMAIRIAEITRIAYVDRPWFKYRRHADTISRKRADVRWTTGFLILEKARSRYPYPMQIVRARRGVLHFRLGQCYLEHRRWLLAASHMVRALWNDPARALSVMLGKERPTSPH